MCEQLERRLPPADMPFEPLPFVDGSSVSLYLDLVHRHIRILCIMQPQTSKLSKINPKPKINTMNVDLELASSSLPKFSCILASSSRARRINVGTVIMATNISTYGFRTVF